MPNTVDAYETLLPCYDEISEVLNQSGLPLSPSGLHGRLCGYICAGQKANGIAWLEALLRVDSNNQMDRVLAKDLFLDLYRYSFSFIAQMDFGFALLLPEDEADLDHRAEELGFWCRGFIEGLAMLGIQIETAQTEELRDALFHIDEIGSLDYDDLSITEEDELSFMEVYEYVRMAVLSLYAELGGQAGSALLKANMGNSTVH